MENNHSMSRVERSRREKVTRYSVRKVSFGAASVAVAAFFMFLGNGAVYAAEPNVTATDAALAATPANNKVDENSGASDSTAPKAQADTTTPASTDASSTSVESSTVSKAQAEATTSKPADATPAPVVSSTTSATEETAEKAIPALDKKQLEDYVAEIDAKLASDSYATKTDESVATLKEHLGLAKLALTTAKSQDELTKAYRRLFMTVNSGLRSKPKAQVESPKLDTTEGKATVGKKASNTEKATGTNSIANSGKHDPRNGRALDGNNPFRTDAATTADDNDSSINETDLDVVNPYFEANGTPTKEEKWKVIDKIDLIGWQLSNSKQTKVVIVNGKATSYGGYGGVVNQTHPYSIPLALYSTKNDATSKSDQFGGIYQDIDVKPGQEVVVGFNSTNFGGFASQDNKVKVTVSYPDKGNEQQGTITWRTLGSPYSGVFTVPNGVTKIRVRLEVADGNVSQEDKGKINIEGKDYYLGPMVSNLTISTGAHIVTTTPQVNYKEVSPSATATTVQATISLDVENKGHYSSGNNKYIVKLPDNAKYISSTGGTKAQVNNGTLTIDYKSLAPGEKKTLTYTVELPADKASSNDFNGVTSFKTSTLYNGLSGDIVAGAATGTVGPKTRNIPVKTQNVTVSMYKTDLKNKVNELETKLAQLNQADYTKESWKAMQDQLAEAKNILSEETNNVPVADRKNQAEINTKLVLLEKEKAKLDLEKAAKDQIAAIEAVDGSVKEEKEAAKAKVIEALAAAKKAVDSATTEADVATKLTEETNKITPILPAEEVKKAAKNDIQSVLEEKKTQIAARDDLTTEEKEAAVKEAESLAQDAKNRVDAATTEESVERNKDRGVEKVEKVDPVAKAKPAAKAAIDAALKAQEQAIDAKPDSTKEEKEAAKAEARAKAEEAKSAIDKAASNGDVTTAKDAGVGTITPVEPKAEVKPAAKQAIEDAYNNKVAEIEKRSDLTTEEKEAAKAEARKLADAAKVNVDKATTDAGVAVVEQQGTTKVANVDPLAKAKPAAKAAIDAALKAQEQAIDAKPDSTKEEKEAAKEEARAKAEEAKSAIDKAASNGDVTTAKDAGVGTITPVEPKAEVKPAAKQAIEDAYTAKVEEIEARPELTTEEKEAAKAEARKLADAAKANVDKAKTDDAVATAEDKGTTKVDNVNPVAKAKPAAKAAIDAALKAQEKAIDAKPESTIEEKAAAKEEARAKAEEAKAAIDAADSNADVTAAKEAGVGTITPVEPKAEVKPAAKQAIEDAYTAKVAEIEKRPELTTEEKEAAKAEARKLADAAKANVDKAKTDDAVAAAEDKGTTKVADVDPAAKAKPAAKSAIDAALKAQEKAIDAKPESTIEEKAAAKEEARAKAEEAKAAIDAADSNADVTAAKEAGVGTITPVEPKAEVKPAAKQAIEDAYTAKVAEIEKRPDLTTEEKAAAKAEARKLADAAKANVDKAKTDDAVAAAEDKGTTKVADVDPAAKAKPAAKAAVDAALAEKDKAIDANDKLSDAEKSAAKEEAKKAADEAKKAIDAATDQAGVDAKATEGTEAVAAANPVGKDKAKAAVDAALAEKDKAIDANDKLSDAEKAAAKEEAKKAADEAKKAIDAATDQAGVDAKATEGTDAVAAVNPVGKDKAKAAVDAALAEKDKAIDANDKLSDAEKSAAKEEAKKAADEAKKAIDAATDQAGVDAKATEGTEAVAAVNPVGKDKAKAAVDAALAEKDKAIDANDKLSDAEKSAAKEEAKKAADEAKKAIDAATDQAGVDAKATEGTEAVAAVNPVGKDKAKAAVDAALAEKDKAIDANDKLSDAEKLAAKEEAKKAADEAKKAIDAAADQAGVDAKATEGTEAVAAVNPVGKDKAKAAVDAALAEKDKAIDANDKLSDAEKSAAKEEAKKAADEAKKAIDAATDQAGVDAKATEGTEAVAAVNPVGKDKAKAAVDAALAEKDKAIDANDKLSDAEKSAAKEEAKKAADEAKKAIDAATDQAGVDAKATEGTDAVAAVNPVGKDKAKAAVDAALAEKDKAIDANDKLSDAEKSAAKEEAKKAADEAKKAIDAATDQAGVDAKATEGTEAVAAVNPVGKDKAKAAVDAALAEKDKAIDANDKLSDAEKSAAKEEAKKAADEAKKAIDAAADQAGVDAKATEGTEAVAAVNPVGKDKAKAAVDAALAEKDKAIDANDKLSDAEKSAAKEEAKKAADEAKKAIDAATDQAGVDAKATEGTEAVAAVNPVGKDKAKAAVDAALAEKDKAIDANDKLSDAEKSAAKEEAKKAADEAKKAIDAATDQAGVDAKATEGTEAVAAVNPVGKDKAKAAVDAALAEKDKAIDANDKLSDAEKLAAKEEAKKAADEAKKAIDAAADQAGVDAKATEGTEAVAAVNPVGKDKAKAAVDAALAEKDKAIDANDKLSDAEKSAAKEEAKKAADEAKKAIDAATDQAGVDAKATEGTEAVAAVNPVGKDKAKAAVDAALAEKDKAIDANDKLSDAEKSAAKEEAKKAADEAKKAIDAATDQAGVDAKATEGTDAVAAVNPVGKDKAKAAVDAALAEKDKAIDANDKLSDAEKSAAKEEAKKAADEAKKAIDAATDQAGVDAKATEGTEAVAAVNPVGKDKAKAAVDAALAEKDKAIDANDKLSDAEKSAAKEEAKKAADEAKKAIDAAADQAGVDAKATEGTEAVAAVNPVGKDKAKAAVDAALAEKDKAIDANDKLSDAEKSAAKEEAKKAADEAKKAIDAATDQAGVDAKATEGTEAVAAVNPVGKDKAKAAVDAALAEKDKAIDANDKLSDAEKSAAKEEAKKAADEAKKAIDAATDQAGVDAKATEGTEAVAAANPVGKDKAKAAVDAALAEKDKAIDANDKLSDAEKAAAKEEAKKAADEAKKAIDAATDQAGVDAKATEGTDAVAAVNPVGKDKAKAAVDAALAEKDKAIDANDKLSDAEKSAAKEEAKKAADEAKKAIDAATDQAGVDAKATEGTDAVAAVNPVGKDKAKAAVDAALAEKDKAIDANDKLSDAEKSAAKAQVAAEAKKAIEAIEKATTEADVEAAKEAGKAEIAKVAPETTDYKAKAKAEVEAELAKKLAELENATDLTEAEKAAAKAQVVNKAKEAIEAIQKAATEADVDQAIRNFVYRISAVIREQEEYDLSKLFVNGSVTVKQGESLTDKDVLSKLNLPSGVEIVKVEKPTTSALGTVMAKVTVKLADGSVEEINVPVEVIVSQNHGNEGNGANNGANNTEAKVNKAKLEGAIHQLDELIIKESAKLDAETAKEANALSADAKKVFANADASQAEVDAMVKRIEDFMAKVAPSTNHANTANDQSAQTPAVAPATTQAAANASQTVSAQANARKAAKELPNTGTVNSTVAMVAAAASALLGLGLAGRRRKEDEEA